MKNNIFNFKNFYKILSSILTVFFFIFLSYVFVFTTQYANAATAPACDETIPTYFWNPKTNLFDTVWTTYGALNPDLCGGTYQGSSGGGNTSATIYVNQNGCGPGGDWAISPGGGTDSPVVVNPSSTGSSYSISYISPSGYTTSSISPSSTYLYPGGSATFNVTCAQEPPPANYIHYLYSSWSSCSDFGSWGEWNTSSHTRTRSGTQSRTSTSYTNTIPPDDTFGPLVQACSESQTDSSAPTCTASQSGSTLSATCSDTGGSGCVGNPANKTGTTSGTYTFSVMDNAGNSGSCSIYYNARDISTTYTHYNYSSWGSCNITSWGEWNTSTHTRLGMGTQSRTSTSYTNTTPPNETQDSLVQTCSQFQTDSSAPTCTASQSGSTLSAICSDTGGSGCSGNPPNQIGTVSGTYTFLVNDNAGNPGSCSISYNASCLQPTTQTRTLSCSSGYTGLITQQRTKSSAPACEWGVWATTSDTCVPVVVETCPEPTTETKTTSCSSGYTGSITQQRIKGSAPTCAWGNWAITSNTCTELVSTIVVNSNIDIPASSKWSIGPKTKIKTAVIKGYGTNESYEVTPDSTGTLYTITPQSVSGYSGPTVTNSVTGNGSSFMIFGNNTNSETFSLNYTPISAVLPASVSLNAFPTVVSVGDRTRLFWQNENVESCTGSGGSWSGSWSGAQAINGSSDNVGPIVTDTQYTLRCLNILGQETIDSVLVTIIPPDFSLQKTSNVEIAGVRGTSTPSIITILPQNGFSSAINLSISYLPPQLSGAKIVLSKQSISSSNYGSGAEFRIITNNPIATGSYLITVQGQSGGLVRTVNVVLNVDNKKIKIEEF